jgi:hypothetical protein
MVSRNSHGEGRILRVRTHDDGERVSIDSAIPDTASNTVVCLAREQYGASKMCRQGVEEPLANNGYGVHDGSTVVATAGASYEVFVMIARARNGRF